jgi:hypothetical protein
VKRVRGLPLRVTGTQQVGWRVVTAHEPASDAREVAFDLEVQTDATGYLLCLASQDGLLYEDTWHAELDDALRAAAELGVPADRWEDAPA